MLIKGKRGGSDREEKRKREGKEGIEWRIENGEWRIKEVKSVK
jgi:hypothetical protein